MGKVLRYAGQAALFALFAVFIGYFSTAPRYRHLPEDAALLRLSFKHPGKITVDCRQRSAEELAKMPAQLRTQADCPRERSPVRVRVEFDGSTLIEDTFSPSGLSRDGAAAGYRRVPITAGEHRVRVQFNDDVRVPGYNFEREQTITAVPGQVILIDFNAERGGILIK